MTALEACEKTDNIWSSCLAPLFWKGFINRRKINSLEKTSETLSFQFGLFSMLGVSCWKSIEFHKAIFLMFICPYSEHAILISILRVCICWRRLGQYDYQNRRKEFRMNETLVSISIARRQNKKAIFFSMFLRNSNEATENTLSLDSVDQEIGENTGKCLIRLEAGNDEQWWITLRRKFHCGKFFLVAGFSPIPEKQIFPSHSSFFGPYTNDIFPFLLHHKRVNINNSYKSISRRWKRNFQAIKKLVKMIYSF